MRAVAAGSSDSSYANPNQTVQVSNYADGNVLTGLLLDWLIPFQSAKTDLQIVDIQPDGSLLAYSMVQHGVVVSTRGLWATSYLRLALCSASSGDTLEEGGSGGRLASMVTTGCISTPGEILQEEFFDSMGISCYRLAKAIGNTHVQEGSRHGGPC